MTRAALALLASVSLTACILVADGKLTDISPPPAAFVPTIEHGVAAEFFAESGGFGLPSEAEGRDLNATLLGRWKTAGWIQSAGYVQGEAFTGQADYEVTLHGSMNQRVTLWRHVLFLLTVGLVPQTQTFEYDMRYSVRERATGRVFKAQASDSVNAIAETFLIFAAPFVDDGLDVTFQRLANHLYQQLYDQGAFHTPPPSDSPAPAAP